MDTCSLYFDLRGHSSDTDGARNPAWRLACQPFYVTDGDLGPIGQTYVAIHTVDEHGAYHGRDSLGRAVVLEPATFDYDPDVS